MAEDATRAQTLGNFLPRVSFLAVLVVFPTVNAFRVPTDRAGGGLR